MSKSPTCNIEKAIVKLLPSCGIFITMNPGYAGRTELPDNLKSMFRPISMVVPDSNYIAEILLFGEGFNNTRILAKKVYTLYQLLESDRRVKVEITDIDDALLFSTILTAETIDEVAEKLSLTIIKQ